MSHVDDGTLHAHLDGELSRPEAQGVEAHVAQCPACRERLEEERALIARASELLAHAAPPDRDLPPFRPGDLKPPARLWWQVRMPIAWAATIALALGIGTYVGEHGLMGPRAEQTPPASAAVIADRAARAAPASGALAARDSSAAFVRQRRAELRVAGPQPLASKAAALGPARVQMMKRGDSGYATIGGPIGADSARVLLARDPLVLPEVPIRAIYQGRMLGYSRVVIIEQALDSTTMIEVINGRPVSLALQEVVVTGAGEALPDSQSPGSRALANARQADSPEAVSRRAPAPSVKRMRSAEQAVSDLFADVRGPLTTDSLASLRRLLRPLRP